jgi:hypothetical protein
MKKVLVAVLVMLFWSSVGFGININELNKLNNHQIGIALINNKLSGFYLVEKTRFTESYYRNKNYEFNHEGKLSKGKWKIKNNKICTKYDDEWSYDCVELYKGINNGKIFYYFVHNNEIFAGAGIIGNVSVTTTNKKQNKTKKQDTKYAQSEKDIVLKCVASGHSPVSIVLNPDTKKIVFNGYKVNTHIIWGDIIYFMNPDPDVYNSKLSDHKEVKLNRITGELLTPTSSSDLAHIFYTSPGYQCSKAKALF